MNQSYLNQWTEITNHMQRPLRAIIELNMSVLQEFEYLRPSELLEIRNPQQLIEKQMQIALKNGHKALDYMQRSFQIFEEALQRNEETVKKTAREGNSKRQSKSEIPPMPVNSMRSPMLDPSAVAMEASRFTQNMASSLLNPQGSHEQKGHTEPKKGKGSMKKDKKNKEHKK